MLPSVMSDHDPRGFDSLTLIMPTRSTIAPSTEHRLGGWQTGTCRHHTNNKFCPRRTLSPIAQDRGKLWPAPQRRTGEHRSFPDGVVKIRHGVLLRLQHNQMSQTAMSFDRDTEPSRLRRFLLTTSTESQIVNGVPSSQRALQPPCTCSACSLFSNGRRSIARRTVRYATAIVEADLGSFDSFNVFPCPNRLSILKWKHVVSLHEHQAWALRHHNAPCSHVVEHSSGVRPSQYTIFPSHTHFFFIANLTDHG